MNRQRIAEIPRVKFDAEVVNESDDIRYWNNIINNKLLDIGCYDKLLKRYLRERITYTGIDYPQVDLEKDRLPFKSKFFDYVCCFEMLEHLVDQSNCIKEIKRVIKKDGLIFISLPNIDHIFFRYLTIFGKPWGNPYTVDKRNKHYHYANFNQNLKFIRKNFKIVKIYHQGNFLPDMFPNLFAYRTVFVVEQ